MNATVFRSMFVSSLKDKISLFYAAVFPLALLIGLGLYFDSPDYRERLLTGVLAISTLFWGVQGIAFQVHQQRSRGVYKLLKLTPSSVASFVLALTLARTALGLAINAIVFAIGAVMFGIPVSPAGVALLLPLLVAGTFVFTCIGFLVANLARNEAQINMISNLLQLPMVFGSAAFYGLSRAPEWLVTAGKLLPFTYFVDGMRAALDEALPDTLKWIAALGLFIVIALALASFTFRYDSEQGLQARGKRA